MSTGAGCCGSCKQHHVPRLREYSRSRKYQASCARVWRGLNDLIQALPQLPRPPLLVGNHGIQQAQCIRWKSAAQPRSVQQMHNVVWVFNRLQPVLHRSQGSREFTSGGNHHASQGLCDSWGSLVRDFGQICCQNGWGTVFPVVLTLICRTCKRLGERLRGIPPDLLVEGANRRSEPPRCIPRSDPMLRKSGRSRIAGGARLDRRSGLRYPETVT